MLRIAARNCRQGMVLARPVYDSKGDELGEPGETLTEASARKLAESGVAQVFVKDPRVADILVAPMFHPELEVKAVVAVQALLQRVAASGGALTPHDVAEPRNAVMRLVRCLFPTAYGEADVGGCTSLAGYDFFHPARTATLALTIGRAAGFDGATLVNLGLAAMLMNIGYVGIDPAVLGTASGLDAAQRAVMQQHVARSVAMLRACDLHQDVLDAVQQHHERWDGKGYPEGRQRGEISPLAQIISLADVFHSLVSRRPHREALQPHEAVEYILAGSAELFDPELVQFFCRAIPHYPTGVMVKLNTNEVAVVIDPNIGHVARPVVRVFRQGGLSAPTYDLDLSAVDNMKMLIVGVVL